MNAVQIVCVAVPAVLLVLGTVWLFEASEAASDRRRDAARAAERESRERQSLIDALAAQSQRALGVLEESLKPAPPLSAEVRRLDLENAVVERAQAFDLSDPFDDVAAERLDAAPLGDDDDMTGIPGFRFEGRLDGEQWEATT